MVSLYIVSLCRFDEVDRSIGITAVACGAKPSRALVSTSTIVEKSYNSIYLFAFVLSLDFDWASFVLLRHFFNVGVVLMQYEF